MRIVRSSSRLFGGWGGGVYPFRNYCCGRQKCWMYLVQILICKMNSGLVESERFLMRSDRKPPNNNFVLCW